jgi:hypothetical protein
MRRLARLLVDNAPAILLPLAIALNIRNWRTGRPTICNRGRAVLRPDTLPGRALSLTAWAAFASWFAIHFCYPKRP